MCICSLYFAAQEDAETLEAIRETMENNNGRVDDIYVIKFFREKLKSMPCQNQGFLLDGFPKTMEQAKELFAREFLAHIQLCVFFILHRFVLPF